MSEEAQIGNMCPASKMYVCNPHESAGVLMRLDDPVPGVSWWTREGGAIHVCKLCACLYWMPKENESEAPR